MAVFALVLSLICFIPGAGVLAVIMGIFSLLNIRSSRGRLGGTGLAATGLVIGLIVSLIWVAISAGLIMTVKTLEERALKPMGQAMSAVESGDIQALNKQFKAPAGKVLDAQAVADFRQEYTASLGSFTGMPDGWMEIAKSYSEFGPAMQNLQGINNVLPFPGLFVNNKALVLGEIDPTATGSNALDFKNIGLLLSDGTEFWLMDFVNDAPLAPPSDSGEPQGDPASGEGG